MRRSGAYRAPAATAPPRSAIVVGFRDLAGTGFTQAIVAARRAGAQRRGRFVALAPSRGLGLQCAELVRGVAGGAVLRGSCHATDRTFEHV
jgi:hypothetical protein